MQVGFPSIRPERSPIFARNRTPRPRLDPLDPGYSAIEFQFVPQDLSRNVSARYGEDTAFGRNHPIMQFVAQDGESYRFRAMLFAETYVDRINETLAALERAVRTDPQLKRPPIWALTWGAFLSDPSVVVESIGNVQYGNPRPSVASMPTTGPLTQRQEGAELRSVTLDVSLRHYEPFVMESVSPSDPIRNTFYHRVRNGETYEHLGARYYGDALKGELLRRRNPGREELAAGDIVMILKPERFRGIVPTPASIPLARTAEASRMRADLFELRGRTRVVHGGLV